MYIMHFDAVYLTMRGIYLIMAVIGLVNWAKLNRDRNANNEKPKENSAYKKEKMTEKNTLYSLKRYKRLISFFQESHSATFHLIDRDGRRWRSIDLQSSAPEIALKKQQKFPL